MCERCGFVFLANPPTPEEITSFYADSYQAHRHHVYEYEAAVQRLKDKGSYEIKAASMRDFKEYINTTSKVLEIGTGYGTFLRALRDTYSCTVEGIEPGEIAARVANEHYGLDVMHGSLDQFLQKNTDTRHTPFDLIIMLHVLEHLPFPFESLKAIHTLLSDEGLLYLAVPNVAAPEEAAEKFFHFEHLSYFSPKTLLDILVRSGFKIIRYEERPRELVMVATKSTSMHVSLDTSDFDTKYAPERIARSLSVNRAKYRILRFVKKCLPQKLVRRIVPSVSALLRRMGIIGV